MKTQPKDSRTIAIWVYIGVGMLLIQVMLGGITRLTGSGLSITEWNIVTGALPPLNEQQWMAEFSKYQQTPQYHYLNSGFSLSDFKFIFFWEWFHRQWARLIAVVFAIPFLIFLAKGKFSRKMIRPLLVLFFLGALQGAIGWIMVASGLTGDAVYVKPTKLALHFVFALGLIAYAWWFALQLSVPREAIKTRPSLRKWTWAIIGVLFLQLIYGAIMAGHRAANAAPSWPTINGQWIPDNLLRDQPPLINFIENKITIHFVHRTLAYLLVALTIVWTVKAFKQPPEDNWFRNTRWLPLSVLLLQLLLGILTVLGSSTIVAGKWGLFEWLAELHQVTGMSFLLVMVWMLFIIRRGPNTLSAV